ncbi:MAG: hypothetical protein L3J92_01365 [Thermoplasmata archaeon]|jgi:hypothetical protein|nr:hypothetical protein [Thermoplasmata archaeon]
MPREELTRIERLLLVHLLDHRGNQVRFEADQWTTEFGIARKFAGEDPGDLKNAMRTLEMGRMIYRRTQYVVGYSEPKHVLSLTATGHRMAIEVQRDELASPPEAMTPEAPATAASAGSTAGRETRHRS